jgi:hypothetical protein
MRRGRKKFNPTYFKDQEDDGKTRLKITSVLTRVCVKNFGRTAEELPDGQQNSSLTELQ